MTASAGIRIEQRSFTVAELGPQNPLPPVGPPLETRYRFTGAIPREIIEETSYGNPPNLYPYELQDGYTRATTELTLQTIVLENEALRAVFLPELGGRLWELFDKTREKHLLHSPRTIQFANLALRDAWFAGGIEWNIGTRGHSPTTCSPLHAGIVRTTNGSEVLRMWEFDRLREVVFTIDAWLPPGSRVLYTAVRITNPGSEAVPMYWWTNAAVPSSDQTRVIAPSGSAFTNDYEGGVRRIDATSDDGVDCTWPSRNSRARDFFFDVPSTGRPWILAADADGDGLALLSTSRLHGRKLFVWGEGGGGRRWQRWLSPDGTLYAEIQAGLAQTQLQHLPMPAGARWSWVEAYGNARVDPAQAGAADFTMAAGHARTRVDDLADSQHLEAALAASVGWADHVPHIVTTGTGWGALERHRRARAGIDWIDEAGMPFPDGSLTPKQLPWLTLLEGGRFAGATTFVRGTDWELLLETAGEQPEALVHLAVMAHARGETDTAAALYRRALTATGADVAGATESNAAEPNLIPPAALAHRGLALLDLVSKMPSSALMHYRAACGLVPQSTPLRCEAATGLLAIGEANGALALLDAPGIRHPNGRLHFLRARALAATGHRADAAAILRDGLEVPDLREGENSIAALWEVVCPGEVVPPDYEFRMT